MTYSHSDGVIRQDGRVIFQGDVYHAAEVDEMVQRASCFGDLLEACELAMKFWYSGHPNDTVEGRQTEKTFRDAIAKAMGTGT